MENITEYSITLDIKRPKVVSSAMPVFYNPAMASQRNIAIALINALQKKDLKIADVLSGSGIRALRFLKELDPSAIKFLLINDSRPNFANTFHHLSSINNIPHVKLSASGTIHLRTGDANIALLESSGFDYIEIDPFGTPNPFLAASIARLSQDGILAVTATDTAALTGTYPKVTARKYWAQSLKNSLMHETGLRILIRKIQLLGLQFDKALIPCLSYHKSHYFRIYFRCHKGKKLCDTIIKQHNFLLWCPSCCNYKPSEFNLLPCDICSSARDIPLSPRLSSKHRLPNARSAGNFMRCIGPLWLGILGDENLIRIMITQQMFPSEHNFLTTLLSEIHYPPGFFEIHEMSSLLKINPPRLQDVLSATRGVRTHFDKTGIKSSLNSKEFSDILLDITKSTKKIKKKIRI